VTAEAAIAAIEALYAARGDAHYGEGVSQTEHALQCAKLAHASGADDALVAAALLHDYGHLIDDRGRLAERDRVDGEHEALGALALSAWFGEAVTRPIALHVAAKRWLCASEPGYHAALSPASQLSLTLQGGAFALGEGVEFAALPHADEAVRLRRWDDQGKVVGADAGDFARYRPLLLRLARGR
jgi:phosphonate degradation associated HDIG domain protein